MSRLSSNVISKKEYREQVAETLDYLANVVGDTLGPYGSHSIVQDAQLQHFATKDGYSVLRKIFFKENLPRTILDLLKRISYRLVRTVGDGSTSAVVASNEIFRSISGMQDGIELPPKDVTDALSAISGVLRTAIETKSVSVTGKNIKRLKDVAFISTNNDAELADLVYNIFVEAGVGCSISVETGTTSKTITERTSGIEVDRGIINPYFSTSTTETGVKCEYENAFVFMCDDNLGAEDMQLVGGAMSLAIQYGQPFIIVAKGYDATFRDFLHMNKVSNKALPIAAIDIATESPEAYAKFQDLATYCGCKYYAKYASEKINEFPVERLGRIGAFKATDRVAKFLDGKGDIQERCKRVETLNRELGELALKEDHIERDTAIILLRNRIAALTDGMVVVHVGGDTPQEIEARKFLVEDAVFACQSALKFGVVMGGSLVVPKLLNLPDVRSACMFAVKAKTMLDEESIEKLIDAIDNAFRFVFAKVLQFANSPIAAKKIQSEFPELLVGVTDPAEMIKILVDACVMDWETVLNVKTFKFEKFPETTVINSAETDYEIVRSVFSIIALLATSGQFVSTSLVDPAHYGNIA